jgi:RNA polymerase primary sigma factor
MPDQKSGKLAKAAAKPAAKKPIKRATPPKAQLKIVKNVPKPPPGVSAKPTKDQPVSLTKSSKPSEKAVAKDEAKKAAARPAAAATDEVVKKKPGRPPKAQSAGAEPAKASTGAKRGRKPKQATDSKVEDLDLSDIEDELAGEPVAEAAATEKVKPLRMKISKAKERALMKEFGLDEAILTEEEMLKRRQRLKTLIKLGKTRGYLTHAEITDHLPEKLVDAETLEVVVSMLNDMGVAVYEQTPDAETLLLTNTGPTAATEEEAEEEAEAALSTVDSEFGRTTDPVRMYMREMGTVELLTREGEIEIAKRIEGGLMAMMEAISASPATIAEILRLANEIREGRVVISTVVDGFSNPNEADDYVAEEDFDEFDADDDYDVSGVS